MEAVKDQNRIYFIKNVCSFQVFVFCLTFIHLLQSSYFEILKLL